MSLDVLTSCAVEIAVAIDNSARHAGILIVVLSLDFAQRQRSATPRVRAPVFFRMKTPLPSGLGLCEQRPRQGALRCSAWLAIFLFDCQIDDRLSYRPPDLEIGIHLVRVFYAKPLDMMDRNCEDDVVPADEMDDGIRNAHAVTFRLKLPVSEGRR